MYVKRESFEASKRQFFSVRDAIDPIFFLRWNPYSNLNPRLKHRLTTSVAGLAGSPRAFELAGRGLRRGKVCRVASGCWSWGIKTFSLELFTSFMIERRLLRYSLTVHITYYTYIYIYRPPFLKTQRDSAAGEATPSSVLQELEAGVKAAKPSDWSHSFLLFWESPLLSKRSRFPIFW